MTPTVDLGLRINESGTQPASSQNEGGGGDPQLSLNMVEHFYQPNFDDTDDSCEIGQEDSLTVAQLTMIQSQKTVSPQEDAYANVVVK